ncbi:uncharacterized protein [Bemisia tabaci]|uniref:uncharacterized protein isoform X3 n=1 Tax=Bemisia tabaci TaxID=7038 RepID=UPI003B27E879
MLFATSEVCSKICLCEMPQILYKNFSRHLSSVLLTMKFSVLKGQSFFFTLGFYETLTEFFHSLKRGSGELPLKSL